MFFQLKKLAGLAGFSGFFCTKNSSWLRERKKRVFLTTLIFLFFGEAGVVCLPKTLQTLQTLQTVILFYIRTL